MKIEKQTFEGFARILSKRRMGGIVFTDSLFREEKIQLVFQKNQVERFEKIINVSIGDLVHIVGEKGETHSGEKSFFVKRIIEVLRNTSEIKTEQIKDQRTRFTNRHLDIGLNSDSFEFWKNVSCAISTLRNHMAENSFYEFNTCILQATRDAGLANAFTTYCKATKKNYALSLTSELKLKRLIAGGFSRVYEISQSFRNEGMNKEHTPEFTLMEAYAAEWTSEKIENLLEKMISTVLKDKYSLNKEKLLNTFDRYTFQELWNDIVGHTNINLSSLCALYPNLFNSSMPEFTWVYKFICKVLAPKFNDGTFITGLPHGFSPFAKKLGDNRFMDGGILIIEGMHIATYSADTNDYETVKRTLEKQASECNIPLNTEFLNVLKFGLPPIAGFGLGVNRLMMLFLDKLPKDVKETCLYPLT